MTVLIIEDNPLFATSLRDLVKLMAADCSIIQVATLEQATRMLLKEPVSMVISDIRLPDGMDGEVFTWADHHVPGLPVVVMAGDPSLLDRYRSQVRHGLWIVAKQIAFDTVCTTVEQAMQMAGLISTVQTYVLPHSTPDADDGLIGQVTDHVFALTHRQLHLMELVAVGLSNKEIGRHLEMAPDVVKDVLADIFERLQVKSRADATHVFRQLISTVQP